MRQIQTWVRKQRHHLIMGRKQQVRLTMAQKRQQKVGTITIPITLFMGTEEAETTTPLRAVIRQLMIWVKEQQQLLPESILTQ